MSGQNTFQGVLAQTLATIVYALGDVAWERITVEPGGDWEKADIIFHGRTGSRFVQVKSTRVEFRSDKVALAAAELATALRPGDTGELYLIGPKGHLVGTTEMHGIRVTHNPNPDLETLTQDLAAQLRVDLANLGHNLTLESAEDIVRSLAMDLALLATAQRDMTREEYRNLLADRALRSQRAIAPEIIERPYIPNDFFRDHAQVVAKTRELFRSLDRDRSSSRIVVLSGMFGVGKTQAAVHYSFRYERFYRDIVFLSCGSDSEFRASCQRAAAAAAHVSPSRYAKAESSNAAIQSVKDRLFDHEQWLLIIDSLDDIQPSQRSPEAVKLMQDLITRAARGHILVTTRCTGLPNLGPVVAHIKLEDMPPPDAAAFLQDRTRQKVGSHSETRELKSLIAELAGVPLALEQAGSYISNADITFGEYLSKLKGVGIPLFDKVPAVAGQPVIESTEVRRRSVVGGTFLLSLRAIQETAPLACELLYPIAYFAPSSIPIVLFHHGRARLPDAIARELITLTEVKEWIAPLRAHSFLTTNPYADLCHIHPMAQRVLRHILEAMDPPLGRTTAIEVVGDALAFIDRHTVFQPQDLLQILQILPHARALPTLSEQCEFVAPPAAEPRIRVALVVGIFEGRRGRHQNARDILKDAVAVARGIPSDSILRFRCLSELAETLRELAESSRTSAGILRAEAEKLFSTVIDELAPQPLDDARAELLGQANNDLGFLYRNLGKLDDAERLIRKGLAFREAAREPNLSGLAQSFNNLGAVLRWRRPAEARDYYRESLRIRRQLGDMNRIKVTAMNLAGTERMQKHYAESRALLVESFLSILREHPTERNNIDYAFITQEMGNLRLCEAITEPSGSRFRRLVRIATRHYRRSLRLRNSGGSKRGHMQDAFTYNSLGVLAVAQGHRTALRWFTRALSQVRKWSRDSPLVPIALLNMAKHFRTASRNSVAEKLEAGARARLVKLGVTEHELPDILVGP